MSRFLHIADVHLGFDRYDSPERSKDFFRALRDVLTRYAQDVDFVLIAGDLFEHRSILPHVLNQAQLALDPLRRAQIPVLAIEGNHDNRPYGTNTSWLRYLADHDYLILLEPTPREAGGLQLEAWSAQSKRGGYLDLDCGVRVIGSQWYGSVAPRAIQDLARAIEGLPPGPGQTVLMFHHGLEGQIARYNGALRYADLLPLKQAGVTYLALGHIHKSYVVEGWIHNPGSLEANSMAEAEFERGAFRVEIGSELRAELVRDYWQRPCYRLRYEVRGREGVEAVTKGILAVVEGADIASEAPIVELKLTGQVGFDRAELDIRQLEQRIQALTGALIVLFRFEATPLEFDSLPQSADTAERLLIEEQVYGDVFASHAHYRERAANLAKGLLGLKEMVLDRRPEVDLYDYLNRLYLDQDPG